MSAPVATNTTIGLNLARTELTDLDMLSVDKLQSRFEETCKQVKELESQRTLAVLARNEREMKRISEAEHINSEMLMNLGKALQRKGVTVEIPKFESFMSQLTYEELYCIAEKHFKQNCKVQ